MLAMRELRRDRSQKPSGRQETSSWSFRGPRRIPDWMIVADPSKDESVIELVRETANGLGDLAGLHLKMARRELAREFDALSARAVMLGILVALLLVGYALAVAGVAMFIAGQTSLGRPFVALGGGHVVLAFVGLAWIRRRK